MTDQAWLVKDPRGALVTAYWYPVEQIDVAWHEPASHEE